MKRLCILISVVLVACHTSNSKVDKKAVAIIGDITDRFAVMPDANATTKYLDLSTREDEEAFFIYTEISDKMLTPITRIHFPNTATMDKIRTQANRRAYSILSFHNDIRATITRSHTQPDSSLTYSHCFRTIATVLEELVNSGAKEMTAFVYGDIQENSPIYTCYDDDNMVQLSTRPDEVVKHFNSVKLLPERLDNVQVVFAYSPQTQNQDRRYAAMLKVYQILLESRGAKVLVQAHGDFTSLRRHHDLARND